jgi:hypothetical protein
MMFAPMWRRTARSTVKRVLLFTHTSGRGRTSGLELGPISARSAVLFHFRGGTVVRVVAYWERDHALADLGLAPEADTANQLD